MTIEAAVRFTADGGSRLGTNETLDALAGRLGDDRP